MEWRVTIELSCADGTKQTHGVADPHSTLDPLGLTLDDGKALLAGVQRHLVQARVSKYCAVRRRCPRCRHLRALKDTRTRRLNSLFGTVEVPAPRFKPCPCAVTARSTLCPASELMPDRCTPAYERTLAKLGVWVPYRRTRQFLSEFFPLGDDLPWPETIRRRTMRVGAGFERESLSRAKTPQVVLPLDTMTVSIDAGHVRTARGHQGRTFEVMTAQVSNDDGMPVLFSGVPGEPDQQHTQLNGVLSGLGMTVDTEVTILSGGADGPRSLGKAASTGTVFHVPDWFHLAMRVQHAAQCAGGWPNATVRARRDGARFADAIEHIRWRLWHGQSVRALRLIQRTLAAAEAKAAGKTAAARSAAKLAKALIALETYVSGLADLIIDYASARLDDEPFSTSPTEDAMQWLLHRRMGAQQQMRWSPRGAHLMLQVRTASINGTLEADHGSMSLRRRSSRLAA
ncbi:MAG: ISKra4 family transposase [Nitrospira sp.]|nr:ISKra4 family transposase [Nitrospira sp.]